MPADAVLLRRSASICDFLSDVAPPQALYYLCDTIVFLMRAKVYTGNQEQLQMRGFRMWTLGLAFAMTDKVLELQKVLVP